MAIPISQKIKWQNGRGLPLTIARARRHFAQLGSVRAVLICATFHIDFCVRM
jgi:hypothetical protein